jgi:hypothetical protein
MELPFFLFLYVIANAALNHIENGNLLIRWTVQSRNVCINYLRMNNSNTFGQFHLSLCGVRKIHNYFYKNPSRHAIKSNTYRQKRGSFLKDRIIFRRFFVFFYEIIFCCNCSGMQFRHSQGVSAFAVIGNEHGFSISERSCSTLFRNTR